MPEPPKILIAGGYGVFGMHLAQELSSTTDFTLVLAGRDLARAERARGTIGALERTQAIALDLGDPAALERAATGCFAVACTAGPFQALSRELPAAAARAGAHWLDISDDPSWVLGFVDDRSLDGEAKSRDVTMMTGAAVVPAISGMLARWCISRRPDPDHARVTLFIGNRNRKGTGATASALISRFTDPQLVDLPLGRKTAYRFATPDTELLRRDLRLEAEFRVALEWRAVGMLTAGIGRVAGSLVDDPKTLARFLSTASRPLSLFGSNLGCVQVDLWSEHTVGVVTAAAIAGQRLVTLPCVIALCALRDGSLRQRGVVNPAGWLEPNDYLERLRTRGVRLVTR